MLTTLTYGTSADSYLTIRCIKHHAEHTRHTDKYPLDSRCVARDLYVDDMLTGADSVADALAIRDQTIELLRQGSFELSKWGSNCPELLKDVTSRSGNLVSLDGSANYACWISYGTRQTMHFAFLIGLTRPRIQLPSAQYYQRCRDCLTLWAC